MAKLTKRVVDSAQPDPDHPKRECYVWDSDLSGFGLRIKGGTGAKAFVIQYRPVGARNARRLTLAKVGTLTVEEAREHARRMLAEVVLGGDPAAERADGRQEPTVNELAARFKAEHVAHLKPATRREYNRVLDDIILKKLGSRPLSAVTRGDVAKLHHEQADHPAQANKVLAVVGKLFSFAEAAGLRADGTNPAHHVKKYAEQKREKYLSALELARLGAAIAALEESKELRAPLALLFRLLLVSGCRLNEWLTAKWEWVDLENRVLLLPDTKTGQRAIRLSNVACELLRDAHREATSPWVVVGARRNAAGEWTHVANPHKAWVKVRAAASGKRKGEPDVDLTKLRIHDLRHGYASAGAAAGLGLQVVGALLGHRQASTTSRYSHFAPDALHAAADALAADIKAKLDGKEPAAVVPINQQAAGAQ